MSNDFSAVLPRSFYEQPTLQIARQLLGKVLVREHEGTRTVGLIVETEAYCQHSDPSAHSHKGPTRRNQTMFGVPGHAYVYTIHAKFCFNVVCGAEGVGDAVLVRALEPLEGLGAMRERRSRQRDIELARGPARLCQAMAIDRAWNGWDLVSGDDLWVADLNRPVTDAQVLVGPRVGISKAQDFPWRFAIDTRFASLPKNTLSPLIPDKFTRHT